MRVVFAVQTGEFNGRPWFKYTTKLRLARMWAKQHGAVIQRLVSAEVVPL